MILHLPPSHSQIPTERKGLFNLKEDKKNKWSFEIEESNLRGEPLLISAIFEKTRWSW